MKPAWQTDELEDEWIDQDEQDSRPSASVIHNASDLSLTQPIGSLLVPNVDLELDTSQSGSTNSDTGGTFLVRPDVPSVPILPKTPGKINKGIVKDFFSPLALETMFEPPSPPMNQSTPLPPPPSAPAIPSRLSQVHFPEPEPSTSQDPNVDTSKEFSSHNPKLNPSIPGVVDDPAGPSTYKFTFSAPQSSPFHRVGAIPNAQSTPGPIRTYQNPPPTDPRLRLFHFQYDTFTRDHLSAMVDSIAVNTPSAENVSTPSSRSESTPGMPRVSDRSISRLRSAKRIKLSPPSDFSVSGDGAAVIFRPDDAQRDYVGEAMSFMEKIRQTRDFSTISTSTTSQSPANQKVGHSSRDLSASSKLSSIFAFLLDVDIGLGHLKPPEVQPTKDRVASGSATSSKGYSYSSLGYRQQAANLMAQIRNDVKRSKRSFSAETEALRLAGNITAPEDLSSQPGSSDQSSLAYEHDTEILPDNLDKIPGSPYTSPTVKSSNDTDAQKRLRSGNIVDKELSRSFSQVSLDSQGLLDQFPDPPVGVLVTAPPTAPSSPTNPIRLSAQSDTIHLVPSAPLQTHPASVPSGRNEDLNRFVSSSTTSGTTLTAGSAPSFVKHPGPKQMTYIAPSDVPTLPDRVGRMIFDKVQLKWVKVITTEEVHDNNIVDTLVEAEADSEDPFRDIESLREEDLGGREESPVEPSDGGEMSMELDKSGIQEIPIDSEDEDEEEANLTSFSFDGLSLDVVPAVSSRQYDPLDDSDSEDEESDDDTQTTEQLSEFLAPMDDSYIIEDVDQSQVPPLEPLLRVSPKKTSEPLPNLGLSTPVPQSRITPGAPTPNVRSAMKSNSVTPVSALKNPNRVQVQTPANQLAHRRSVSFSDGKRDGPILGVGRNAPTPDTTTTTESEGDTGAPANASLAISSNHSVLPSARTKRIADMLDDLEDSGKYHLMWFIQHSKCFSP